MLISFFTTLKGLPLIFKYLLTTLVGMLPLIEIRGAIPLGVALGTNYWTSFFFSFIGNIIPIFFIVKYIKPLFDFLSRWKIFKNIINWSTKNAISKIQENVKLQKAVTWGLFIFVAVPLPSTGAWTGALIANFLDIPLNKAFLPLVAGVAVSGLLVLCATGTIATLI